VGNMEGDVILSVADLQMARALRARNCLLWYTASGKPDLGGKEQDDFR
jgi:DNA polymerase epsilon subunit 1